MHISDLVLEVTRKCNLKCDHCVRGCAQRLTMSPEVLRATLQSVSSIGTVCFTGGEPSLAPEVIEEFLEICRWRNIRFEWFYSTTNGRPHNKLRRFLKVLGELYDRADEQYGCALDVSRDQFHNFNKFLLYKFQNEWGEYPEWFKPTNRTEWILNVIGDGRAKKTGVANKGPEVQKPWTIDEENDTVSEENVYISANGNVVSSCDLSYHRIDTENKGNVLVTPLSQIVRSFCVPTEIREAANG